MEPSRMTASFQQLCEPTEFLDYTAPAVQAFIVDAITDPSHSARNLAIDLYYAVRDRIHYEIYGADLSRAGLTASAVVTRRRGLCIHKSVLFAACARALAIPSRLVFVDVRNHLASPRLLRLLQSDVLSYHCFAEVYIGTRWIKVTPVFNEALCRLYRIKPLEFDGQNDSVLHPYDEVGRAFLEVTHEHGTFNDLPYERLTAGLISAHPALFSSPTRMRPGSLELEARLPGGPGAA
jgi:transglutaminase-like putative cysteine protease